MRVLLRRPKRIIAKLNRLATKVYSLRPLRLSGEIFKVKVAKG